MNRRQQLKKLFHEWQLYHGAAGTKFVRDGIIGDEESWHLAHPRILFLLKEAHDRDAVMKACGYDLCLLWRESERFGQQSKMVERRLGQWAADLQLACGMPAITAHQALLQSSVMNLKKLAGGATSNSKEMMEAATQDRHFIEKQIQILNPFIVVCGGTIGFLQQTWGGFNEVDAWCFQRDGRLWLEHYHPAYPAKNKLKQRHHQIVAVVTRQW